MWIKIGFLLVGLLAGSAGTLFMHRGSSCQTSALDGVAMNAMAESAIDAIDMLKDEENGAAQLVLAAAVNSQAQMVFRKPDPSAEELARARNWQSAMREHNARLGLRGAKDTAHR